MGEKKFWQVLESVGVGRDSHGYEGVLNLISIAYDSMSEHAVYTKDMDKEKSDKIYDYLNEMGYYKRQR